MAHVWIPLPDTDFDVTEVAVRWPGDAYLFSRALLSKL